jgi:hypothetical protein
MFRLVIIIWFPCRITKLAGIEQIIMMYGGLRGGRPKIRHLNKKFLKYGYFLSY